MVFAMGCNVPPPFGFAAQKILVRIEFNNYYISRTADVCFQSSLFDTSKDLWYFMNIPVAGNCYRRKMSSCLKSYKNLVVLNVAMEWCQIKSFIIIMMFPRTHRDVIPTVYLLCTNTSNFNLDHNHKASRTHISKQVQRVSSPLPSTSPEIVTGLRSPNFGKKNENCQASASTGTRVRWQPVTSSWSADCADD